jgi:hypothetical protein
MPHNNTQYRSIPGYTRKHYIFTEQEYWMAMCAGFMMGAAFVATLWLCCVV